MERLIVGKVYSRGNDQPSTDVLIQAVRWAIEERAADVVSLSLNLSLGVYATQLVTEGWSAEAAVSRAANQYDHTVRLWGAYLDYIAARSGGGAVIVAAAGNQSRRMRRDGGPTFVASVGHPGNLGEVISVGALGVDADGSYQVASFSNGPPDLAAPGIGVLAASIKPGQPLARVSGTSMACPHVAGLAALWWSHARARDGDDARASDVAARLRASAGGRAPAESRLRRADAGMGMPKAPLDRAV